MDEFLPTVESALSATWGGTVRLTLQGTIEHRTHIARLDVVASPPGMPKTVILKRWRRAGDVGFEPLSFERTFLNEWASLDFVAHLFGNSSLAPQVYVGDKEQGFLVIEDLLDGDTLDTILRGTNAVQAEHALQRYGVTLGKLHAQTRGQSAAFLARRHKLGRLGRDEAYEHLHFLQTTLETLEALGFTVQPPAYRDVQQLAEQLSRLDVFSAFHHGDPIPSNAWIDTKGGCYLFDFEAAHFEHAFLEGVSPRMSFPTCGLAFVSRVPEAIWRQTEAAYRAVLVTSCPETADETVYGAAMTAACALWAFAFCRKWLAIALVGEVPSFQLNRVRQCAIARFEAFVQTSREFNNLSALGETFTKIVVDVRSRWPEEAQDLPLYPAFQAGNVG